MPKRKSVRSKKSKAEEFISSKEAQQIIKKAFEEGVLVWIGTGEWSNRKSLGDSTVREMWLTTFGEHLPEKALKASKDLVNRKELHYVLSPINSVLYQLKRRVNSLPWITRSVFFVHKDRIEEWDEKFKEAVMEMKQRLEEFLARYPALVRERVATNPKLYSEADFPTADRLRRLFRFDWGFCPILSPGDGKIQVMSKARMLEEQKKFNDRMKGVAEQSIMMIRQHFLKMIEDLRDKLQEGKKSFRAPSIENPKKYLEQIFGDLQMFGDKPFYEVCKKAADALDGVFSDDLKDDKKYRESVARKMEGVVKKIKSLPTVKMARDIDIEF